MSTNTAPPGGAHCERLRRFAFWHRPTERPIHLALERVEYLARTHSWRDAAVTRVKERAGFPTDDRSYALGLRILGKQLPKRERPLRHSAAKVDRPLRGRCQRTQLRLAELIVSGFAALPFGIARRSGRSTLRSSEWNTWREHIVGETPP